MDTSFPIKSPSIETQIDNILAMNKVRDGICVRVRGLMSLYRHRQLDVGHADPANPPIRSRGLGAHSRAVVWRRTGFSGPVTAPCNPINVPCCPSPRSLTVRITSPLALALSPSLLLYDFVEELEL